MSKLQATHGLRLIAVKENPSLLLKKILKKKKILCDQGQLVILHAFLIVFLPSGICTDHRSRVTHEKNNVLYLFAWFFNLPPRIFIEN